MSRCITTLAAALLLVGCSADGQLRGPDIRIGYKDRTSDVAPFANTGERLACEMDYKCNRPLTIMQGNQQNMQRRAQAAREGDARRRGPDALPPVREAPGTACEGDCEMRLRKSLVIRDTRLPELPDSRLQ